MLPFHYISFSAHVAVIKGHVSPMNLRNGHVALSVLGVKGHIHEGPKSGALDGDGEVPQLLPTSETLY